MKGKFVILFALISTMVGTAGAQKFKPDTEEDNLKGPVKSMLTTIRTPQGRIVGQPVRNNFNERGYYIQNTYYDTLGNPVIIVAYTYDKNDHLVKDLRTHEPYSELLSQTTYSYDKKANTIVADMLGIADSLSTKTVYAFDKKGVLKSTTSYDEQGKETSAIEYVYDDKGYLKFTIFKEGENEIYKGSDKYRWDTDGNLAEKCSYYLTTLRQAFLYTYYYDEHGNWTQAYLYHVNPTEGYLYQVITRQITYFE